MKINENILKDFQNSNSRILAVTKYLNIEDTKNLIDFLDNNYPLITEGYGENRLELLESKNLSKERTHFIGNLQTKQLKGILHYVDTIHSVDNIKHIKKLEELCSKMGTWVKIFLQINVDDTKEGGVLVEEIPELLEYISNLENVSLIGFSCIGKEEYNREEKEKEFDLMLSLREKYLPNGLISAGTSVDYKIALEKGIDIIRIGTKLYE